MIQTARRLQEWAVEFDRFCDLQSNETSSMEIDCDPVPSALLSKIQKIGQTQAVQSNSNTKTPMQRMQDCRDGLAILDKRGWNRSFHQRLFHEDFLVHFVLHLQLLLHCLCLRLQLPSRHHFQYYSDNTVRMRFCLLL